MNKYAKVAIQAVQLVHTKALDPINAWKKSAFEVFGEKPSAKKGCPRNTFLGLCEEGMVVGVEKGNYTTSVDNKKYAICAVEYIKKDERLADNPKELWSKVIGYDKTHNQQMNVVCELYKQGLLR